MIPSAFMPEGFGRTLKEIHEALLRRGRNKGQVVRSGVPDASRLPDEEVSVWVSPQGMDPDPEQPFNAGMYISRWSLIIVRQATDGKEDSTEYYTLYDDIGKCLRDMIGTSDDLTLDGAVNWIVDPSVDFEEGAAGTANRRYIAARVNVEAHHDLFPVRCG